MMNESSQENVIHVDFGNQENTTEPQRPIGPRRKLTRRQKFMRRTVPTIAAAIGLGVAAHQVATQEGNIQAQAENQTSGSIPIEQVIKRENPTQVFVGTITLKENARLRSKPTTQLDPEEGGGYQELSVFKVVNGVKIGDADGVTVENGTGIKGYYTGGERKDAQGDWLQVVVNGDEVRYVSISEETIDPGVVIADGKWTNLAPDKNLMYANVDGKTIPEYEMNKTTPYFENK